MNERSRRVREAGRHHYRGIVNHSQLDGARVHLRAVARQLQHLLESDFVQFRRFGDEARVGGVDSLHIGIDLASSRAQPGGDGYGGEIGRAPSERGYVHVFGDALESGDDHYFAVRQLVRDTLRRKPGDLRHAEGVGGSDARLRPAEADGGVALRAQAHRHQRARAQFAGGEQNVELAPVGVVRHLAGERDELVGGVAHGADDGDHAVPAVPSPRDARRRVLNLIRIGERTAAVLLHNQRHFSKTPARLEPSPLARR